MGAAGSLWAHIRGKGEGVREGLRLCGRSSRGTVDTTASPPDFHRHCRASARAKGVRRALDSWHQHAPLSQAVASSLIVKSSEQLAHIAALWVVQSAPVFAKPFAHLHSAGGGAVLRCACRAGAGGKGHACFILSRYQMELLVMCDAVRPKPQASGTPEA